MRGWVGNAGSEFLMVCALEARVGLRRRGSRGVLWLGEAEPRADTDTQGRLCWGGGTPEGLCLTGRTPRGRENPGREPA